MSRWLAVAALGAAFLTPPVWGQRRGGVSGGFAGRPGFTARGPVTGGRGPVVMSRSPRFTGIQRGGLQFGNGFNHPISSPFFFHHHHHRFFRFWPYAVYYGYPYYGSNYGDYRSQDYDAAASAYAQNSQMQQAEIDRLNDEVERLRAERETQSVPPSAPSQTPSGAKSESPPTQLVFRDRRSEVVQNYAIVGQTFWILSEQRARKIPLAELDIAATKKANDDRGVDFQLPE